MTWNFQLSADLVALSGWEWNSTRRPILSFAKENHAAHYRVAIRLLEEARFPFCWKHLFKVIARPALPNRQQQRRAVVHKCVCTSKSVRLKLKWIWPMKQIQKGPPNPAWFCWLCLEELALDRHTCNRGPHPPTTTKTCSFKNKPKRPIYKTVTQACDLICHPNCSSTWIYHSADLNTLVQTVWCVDWVGKGISTCLGFVHENSENRFLPKTQTKTEADWQEADHFFWSFGPAFDWCLWTHFQCEKLWHQSPSLLSLSHAVSCSTAENVLRICCCCCWMAGPAKQACLLMKVFVQQIFVDHSTDHQTESCSQGTDVLVNTFTLDALVQIRIWWLNMNETNGLWAVSEFFFLSKQKFDTIFTCWLSCFVISIQHHWFSHKLSQI